MPTYRIKPARLQFQIALYYYYRRYYQTYIICNLSQNINYCKLFSLIRVIVFFIFVKISLGKFTSCFKNKADLGHISSIHSYYQQTRKILFMILIKHLFSYLRRKNEFNQRTQVKNRRNIYYICRVSDFKFNIKLFTK